MGRRSVGHSRRSTNQYLRGSSEMAGQQAAAEVCLPRGKHTVHRHLTCTKVVHDSVEELMQQLEDQGGVERGEAADRGVQVPGFQGCTQAGGSCQVLALQAIWWGARPGTGGKSSAVWCKRRAARRGRAAARGAKDDPHPVLRLLSIGVDPHVTTSIQNYSLLRNWRHQLHVSEQRQKGRHPRLRADGQCATFSPLGVPCSGKVLGNVQESLSELWLWL